MVSCQIYRNRIERGIFMNSRKKLIRKMKKIRYHILHVLCKILYSLICYAENTARNLQEWKWEHHDEIYVLKRSLTTSLVLFMRDLIIAVKYFILVAPGFILFMLFCLKMS